jgi:hypothetical protein
VSHLGAELGEAWSSLRRAGWPGTRAWISGGGCRSGQSAREGEVERNEARGVRRALAGLLEGSWARGRASWPRNPATCASAHALVHGERGGGGTDRVGPQRKERRKRCAGGNSSVTGDPGPRDRERERVSGQRKLAPTGWPHWPASERGGREGELPLTGGVRLSDSAGARPGWADLGRLGCFPFFFFSGFSNSFSISFSIGFSIPNSN